MKKILALLLALVLVTACAPAGGTDNGGGETKVWRVALMVGNLGDLSFNDSAARGVNKANAEFSDVEVTIVEYGLDPDRYEAAVLDTADAGYDVIITSGTLQQFVEKHAADFPDASFIIFDTAASYDPAALGFPNIYGISFKANEASFLGGYLAASLSETGVIAFLGGMDIPVISDFLVGYIEGAQAANPAIKVAYRYAGSWRDSALGKELALAMFNIDNADVIFNVAGGTGIGGIEASVEAGKISIGVDSDQAVIFDSQGRTEYADRIFSSVLKNVDNALFRAISLLREGNLPVGTNEPLGIAEGGVGLADNKFFQANVPANVRTRITELQGQVVSGAIKVTSAYGLTSEQVEAIRSAVRP
jgi:basic membrane protein A and related proteins